MPLLDGGIEDRQHPRKAVLPMQAWLYCLSLKVPLQRTQTLGRQLTKLRASIISCVSLHSVRLQLHNGTATCISSTLLRTNERITVGKTHAACNAFLNEHWLWTVVALLTNNSYDHHQNNINVRPLMDAVQVAKGIIGLPDAIITHVTG